MNKKIIATIATGVAVAGVLGFFFKSEKGNELRKKWMDRMKKSEDQPATT